MIQYGGIWWAQKEFFWLKFFVMKAITISTFLFFPYYGQFSFFFVFFNLLIRLFVFFFCFHRYSSHMLETKKRSFIIAVLFLFYFSVFFSLAQLIVVVVVLKVPRSARTIETIRRSGWREWECSMLKTKAEAHPRTLTSDRFSQVQ